MSNRERLCFQPRAKHLLELVLVTLLMLNGLQVLLINLKDLLYLLELDTMSLLQLLEPQHLMLLMETKVQDQVEDHTPLFMLVDQVLLGCLLYTSDAADE